MLEITAGINPSRSLLGKIWIQVCNLIAKKSICDSDPSPLNKAGACSPSGFFLRVVNPNILEIKRKTMGHCLGTQILWQTLFLRSIADKWHVTPYQYLLSSHETLKFLWYNFACLVFTRHSSVNGPEIFQLLADSVRCSLPLSRYHLFFLAEGRNFQARGLLHGLIGKVQQSVVGKVSLL